MPRPCTHPARAVIDKALIAETDPLRTMADRWSVSKTALIRHKRDHLPLALTQASQAEDVANADALLDQVRSLHTRAQAILAKAEASDRLTVALQAIGEARGCLELLAKLLGELQDGPTTVNILISPEWQRVRGVLLQAVQPYPAIKTVIAAALLSLEGPDAQ